MGDDELVGPAELVYAGINTRVPALSSAVNITFHPDKGRDLTAVQDIPAGSLVLRERPFAVCVFDECATHFCNLCLLPVAGEKAVRCPDCKDEKVVYCSQQCQQESTNGPHAYECGNALGVLNKAGLNKFRSTILLAVRVLARTPIMTLLLAHETLETLEPAAYGTDCLVITANDQFNMIASLMPEQSDEDDKDETAATATNQLSADLVQGLVSHPNWPESITAEKRSQILQKMLLHIMKRLKRNRQGIWEMESISDQQTAKVLKELEEHKASGIYPCEALLNHSCRPNICLIFNRYGELEARTTRPLKTGDSLSHCYGPRQGMQKTAQRREILLKDYFFECKCEACEDPEVWEREREMDAYNCSNCAATVFEGSTSCTACQTPVDQELIKNVFTKTIAALAKPDTPAADLLKAWAELEQHMHKNNTELDDLRLPVIKMCEQHGEFASAERLIRAHIATVKRQYGPTSITLALTMCQQSGVLWKCRQQMYWLMVATALRIYQTHYGSRRLRHMLSVSNVDARFMQALHFFDSQQA